MRGANYRVWKGVMHYLLKREKKADWEALDKIVIRREDVLSV